MQLFRKATIEFTTVTDYKHQKILYVDETSLNLTVPSVKMKFSFQWWTQKIQEAGEFRAQKSSKLFYVEVMQTKRILIVVNHCVKYHISPNLLVWKFCGKAHIVYNKSLITKNTSSQI